jgi:hypothetical protein
MKIALIMILSVLVTKGCGSEMQTDLKYTTVEYTATTRGFFVKIFIQDQMMTISKDRTGVEKTKTLKISDETWSTIVNQFQKINLEKLSDYNDPTQARFYDGAAIADLQIVCKGKIYNSKTFDHGTPPTEIAAFVNTVVSLLKQN